MARRRDEVVTMPGRPANGAAERTRGELDAARIRDLQQRLAVVEERVEARNDTRPAPGPQIDYHQIAAMIQHNVETAVARLTAQRGPDRSEMAGDIEDRIRALVDRVEKFQTEMDRAFARRADETNATITRQIVDSANALHRRITEVAAAERERTESDANALSQRWQKTERDRDQLISGMGDRWQALERELRGNFAVITDSNHHLTAAQEDLTARLGQAVEHLAVVSEELHTTAEQVAAMSTDSAALAEVKEFAADAAGRLTANAQSIEVMWLEIEQMRRGMNEYSDEFSTRIAKIEAALDTKQGLDRELTMDRLEDLERLVLALEPSRRANGSMNSLSGLAPLPAGAPLPPPQLPDELIGS